MTIRDVASALEALTGGHAELLVGIRECAWLDAKGQPYQLDEPRWAGELAKDVAALANAAGGLIVIGLKTRRDNGSDVIEARQGDLVGCCFGVTLQPSTPWWQHLLTPLSGDITTERPGRTLAVVEMLVRAPWRRQHIAQTMHDMLLRDRPEERATLTVLPAAVPAQHAYVKWGWCTVAQKRNPLPGSPVFDVLIKELHAPGRN